MADDQDVTPAILLQHMQAMRGDFSMQMQTMEQRIMKKFDKMDLRFDEINARLGKLERKVELLSVQIGNVDERLDDLEVVQVPMLQKAVGIGGKAGRGGRAERAER